MVRVLVPVEVLEGETVSVGLANLLSTVDVTVLGYHVVPEQTPPDQAQMQYEERATSALEDLAEEFRTAGGDADHRLVFTHDRQQSVDRVAAETDSRAVAITGATGDVDRLLVALTGDVAVDRIAEFVEELVGGRDVGVTLLVPAGEDAEAADPRGEAAGRLRDAGIEAAVETAGGGSPVERLVAAARGHDAIVMGENAPSLTSILVGDLHDRVAAASVGPVLVVRREEDREEEGEVERGVMEDGEVEDGEEKGKVDTDDVEAD